jgi:hypothetical protein
MKLIARSVPVTGSLTANLREIAGKGGATGIPCEFIDPV